MDCQFSIIFPTFNREHVLWDSIRPLLPQLHTQDEILIIDQNNPELEIPPDFKNYPLRRETMKKPGLTRARNLGIQLARGTHILFLDDDITPDPQLLNKMREAAARFPNTVIAGAVDQDDTVPTDGVGSVDLKTGAIITNYTSREMAEVSLFPGGHFLLPRNCILSQPMFCPYFRGAAQGEEVDCALRIKNAGMNILFYPEARIFHKKVTEGGCRSQEYKRNFYLDYCFNEGLFFARNGNLVYLGSFLIRMKNFIEFSSRKAPGRHSFPKVVQGFGFVLQGLGVGILTKIIG